MAHDPCPPERAVTVDEFLDGQTAEGQYVSRGHFTIDSRVARRKLAQFQLGSPEHWVMVLVQAAHRGQAKKIAVTQLPRQTTVTITGGRRWTWDELVAVLDGAETTHADLYTYAVAARALSGNSDLSTFRVITSDGVIGRWKEGTFHSGPLGVEDALAQGSIVFEVHHVGRFESTSPWVEQRASARAELAAISLALTRECMASAVPIWLDGRLLGGSVSGDPTDPHEASRLLAIAPLEHPDVPAVDFSGLRRWRATSIGGVRLSLGSLESSSGPVAGLAVISVHFLLGRRSVGLYSGGEFSKLVWVQDGVVVGREAIALRGALSLTVVASAAGLRTDLSGLVLIENEALAERRVRIRQALGTTLETFWAQSQGVKISREGPSAKRVVLLLAGLAGAVALPPTLAISGPTALISYFNRRLQMEFCNSWGASLDEELSSLAQRALLGFPLKEL